MDCGLPEDSFALGNGEGVIVSRAAISYLRMKMSSTLELDLVLFIDN